MKAIQSKMGIHQPIAICCKERDLQFKYYSDLVFDTRIFNIPVINVKQDQSDIIYELDFQFMADEFKNNQKHLNNFSQLQSSNGQVLVCLLVQEQNNMILVFP